MHAILLVLVQLNYPLRIRPQLDVQLLVLAFKLVEDGVAVALRIRLVGYFGRDNGVGIGQIVILQCLFG